MGETPGRAPLTLQAAHVVVTVVLVVRAHTVSVAVHQQDGSVPTGSPDPLPLPMAKHSGDGGSGQACAPLPGSLRALFLSPPLFSALSPKELEERSSSCYSNDSLFHSCLWHASSQHSLFQQAAV